MRLVQAARLSRLGDASTGIDKQDEAIRRYTDAHGHEIVHACADTNVSGDRDPFARPELGTWLTDPALTAKYDGIIAAFLDRLGRNARQLAELRNWAVDNDKKLIVVSPPLQWPPEPEDLASPIIWDVLTRLAEYELAAIKRRARDTREYLRSNEFLIGRAPWGYRAVPHPDNEKHKTLEPDPELVPYIRGMVDRVLAGDTLTSVCEWLDREGVKPAGGGTWYQTSLAQLLRNPILTGRRKDANGRTLLKVEPIIDTATWRRVQEKLDVRNRRRGGVAEEPAMLEGVVFCAAKCKRPMHRQASGKTLADGSYRMYGYYRCQGTPRNPSRCRNSIRMDELEQWIDDEFIGQFGNREIVERVTIPGNGHEEELEQVAQDMAELLAAYTADDITDGEYDQQMAMFRAERKRLQALPADPDRVEERPTGVTVAERWRALDTAGRRRFLMSARVSVYVQKIHTPMDEIRESLRSLAAASVPRGKQLLIAPAPGEPLEAAQPTIEGFTVALATDDPDAFKDAVRVMA